MVSEKENTLPTVKKKKEFSSKFLEDHPNQLEEV